MIAPEQQLSDEDIDRIASLHVESIDDSLPALIGPAFARAFYRFLERSQDEIVLLERIDGRIESACVVSFAPGSLQARIARATLPTLLPGALVALFTQPAFRRLLRNLVADVAKGDGHADKAPEITYVFTNQQLRGQRLGQRLVGRVDAELAARGIDRYYVKTIDDPANRAVRFYDENGFERLGPRVEGGRTFIEFQKPLAA